MSSRTLVRPEGCPYLLCSHNSRALKGEDVVFVYEDIQLLRPDSAAMGKWDLFCVCDGHGGPEAAQFAKINLPALIAAGLPKGPAPDTETGEGQCWLRSVRHAINAAFIQLDLDFRKEGVLPTVGCTVTIALFCGWILTVANVGDSEAFLDLGSGNPVEVTTSHKIDTNMDEQLRLARCGKEVRPLSEELFRPARSNEEGVGPLRVWPCGLAVSRAVGDYDCGREVLASPHITQIKIPFGGARLMIASDGLWDHLTAKRIVQRSRKHVLREVPTELISKAEKVSSIGLTDDTTVLVVDILPTPKTDFKDISRKLRGPRNVISKLSKKIGGKRKAGYPKVVLVIEDMAPVEPGNFSSGRSLVSTTSSKAIRRRGQVIMKSNTFTGLQRDNTDSESHEEVEEHEVEGLSADLDGGGQSSGITSMPRFRSAALGYD